MNEYKDLKSNKEPVVYVIQELPGTSIGRPKFNIMGALKYGKLKVLLKENTQRAVDAGAFGVPTFFIKDEMFFGKEALREMPDFISSKK